MDTLAPGNALASARASSALLVLTVLAAAGIFAGIAGHGCW